MKTLGLIRHAKSSLAQPEQDDFDRPLNERGKKDAPIMGERLRQAGYIPDRIIASTAKRARQTAEAIAKGLQLSADVIVYEDDLYHAPAEIFEKHIQELNNDYDLIFFIGHNPGITECADNLSQKFHIDEMPTCAVVITEADIDHWDKFNPSHKQVIYYDFPKNIK